MSLDDLHALRIRSDGSSYGTEITLDGRPLEVVSIEIKLDARHPSLVTAKLEVECQLDVDLTELGVGTLPTQITELGTFKPIYENPEPASGGAPC
jgi:hypothetical protein